MAATSSPPLVLDDEEAVAIALGLLIASQSPVSGIAEASVRALSTTIQVMPKRLRRRIDALRAMTETQGWTSPRAGVDPESLTVLALACRDGERVDFDYLAAGDVASHRQVEPHRLVSLDRTWYLVAYDLARYDWRTFRLDRLSAPRSTGVHFAHRQLPATDAAAFVRAGIAQAPRAFTVEAVVAAPAVEVRAQIGRWATVAEEAVSICTVRISTDSLDWAAFALALTGAEFRVQGPRELIEHLRGWAVRLAGASGQWVGPAREAPGDAVTTV
jgi:predicted DNA-binding transcriptional regulator YafY